MLFLPRIPTPNVVAYKVTFTGPHESAAFQKYSEKSKFSSSFSITVLRMCRRPPPPFLASLLSLKPHPPPWGCLLPRGWTPGWFKQHDFISPLFPILLLQSAAEIYSLPTLLFFLIDSHRLAPELPWSLWSPLLKETITPRGEPWLLCYRLATAKGLPQIFNKTVRSVMKPGGKASDKWHGESSSTETKSRNAGDCFHKNGEGKLDPVSRGSDIMDLRKDSTASTLLDQPHSFPHSKPCLYIRSECSYPISLKKVFLLQQIETITGKHNWTQCGDLWIVGSPTPVGTFISQILHL